MRILAIMIAGVHPLDQKVYILLKEYQLDSIGFLYRGTVKDSFKFVCRESLNIMDKGSRHKVKHENHMIYTQVGLKSHIGAYAFCDEEYPPRLAYKLLNECIELFEYTIGDQWNTENKSNKDQDFQIQKIQQQLVSYQDPKQVDQIMIIEQNLQQVKEIMHENLQEMLAQQGNLEQLIEKSKDLSTAAKSMYKSSKKINSNCCQVF